MQQFSRHRAGSEAHTRAPTLASRRLALYACRLATTVLTLS